MKIEFLPIRKTDSRGKVRTIDLLYGRGAILTCFQCPPSDFKEVSWDGTQFRILTDDSSSG